MVVSKLSIHVFFFLTDVAFLIIIFVSIISAEHLHSNSLTDCNIYINPCI